VRLDRRSVLVGMAAASTPLAARAATPETTAEIPGPLLLEGIAHDGRRLYLGAVAGRNILTLDRGGRPSTLLPESLLGVFGLAADPKRNRLWAATALLDEPGRSELVEIDTLRRRAIARHAPPDGNPVASFGDVALTPDGDVLVSDSKGGAILRLRRGSKALETVVPAGKMRSPQGMVATRGRLIVADYSTGLHQVDLATGASAPIEGANIRGVDALIGWRGDLIAIQNGGAVPRILRLKFDAAGNPAGGDVLYEGGVLIEPTLGTVVGDHLLFIGRSQWGEADAKGKVKAGSGPTRVMSLALA
jgi:hypothetical protein